MRGAPSVLGRKRAMDYAERDEDRAGQRRHDVQCGHGERRARSHLRIALESVRHGRASGLRLFDENDGLGATESSAKFSSRESKDWVPGGSLGFHKPHWL